MDAVTFVAGMVVGVLLGLLVGPLLRAALVLREYRRASAEAGLTEEVLRRMVERTEEAPAEPDR
ncbi:MAG: hypothetical protein ACRDI0_04510 [Actinomycetota bacterium]